MNRGTIGYTRWHRFLFWWNHRVLRRPVKMYWGGNISTQSPGFNATGTGPKDKP